MTELSPARVACDDRFLVRMFRSNEVWANHIFLRRTPEGSHHMLKHVEMDPSLPMRAQYGDTSGAPVILINLFDVDPKDSAAFTQAWTKDAEFFRAQPGYISAQLHHGIGNSRLWLNYAVFENVPDFAATNDQPQFGPLRAGYPDSATSRPALFRCVAIPGICVDKH